MAQLILSETLKDFKDWCNGNFIGYAENLYRWSKTFSNGRLIDLLLKVRKTDIDLYEKVKAVFMSKALEEKYKHYNQTNNKSGSRKSRIKAGKRANTSDNLVSHLNKFFEYIESDAHILSSHGLSNSDRVYIDSCIGKYEKKTFKSKGDFIAKLRSSLESQDRVYNNMAQKGSDSTIMTFPITLIREIVGGRSGLKVWEDEIIFKELKIYTNEGEKSVGDIVDVTIIPYKKSIITINVGNNKTKRCTLLSRKDENATAKTLKAGEFGDISIGHMPPLSEVIRDLVKNQDNPLPGIKALTDIIITYCNETGQDLGQDILRKQSKQIYSQHVAECNALKKQLLEDLKTIHNKEEYELQSTRENIQMGGSNRER